MYERRKMYRNEPQPSACAESPRGLKSAARWGQLFRVIT